MLIDSHCHIDFAIFDDDRESILTHCQSLSIKQLIVPGTQARSWQKLLSLAVQFPSIKPALGLHPYFLGDYQPTDLIELSRLIQLHAWQIVALGEIGLDFAIDVEPILQKKVFEQQLEIAVQYGLPVILHHRQSHNQIIQCLKAYRFQNGGIVHAFSGSLQQANTYIDLGFKLGVGGTITYERAKKTRSVLSQVPLESLVLETDSPDMPINGKQGQRNSPINLIAILHELAVLRNESKEQIIKQCYKNVCACLKNIE